MVLISISAIRSKSWKVNVFAIWKKTVQRIWTLRKKQWNYSSFDQNTMKLCTDLNFHSVKIWQISVRVAKYSIMGLYFGQYWFWCFMYTLGIYGRYSTYGARGEYLTNLLLWPTFQLEVTYLNQIYPQHGLLSVCYRLWWWWWCVCGVYAVTAGDRPQE